MDEYGVSLGIQHAAKPNAVGQKQHSDQQKKQEQQKNKKDKQTLHASRIGDQAIISGKAMITQKAKKEKDEEPCSGKGDFIDIQV